MDKNKMPPSTKKPTPTPTKPKPGNPVVKNHPVDPSEFILFIFPYRLVWCKKNCHERR